MTSTLPQSQPTLIHSAVSTPGLDIPGAWKGADTPDSDLSYAYDQLGRVAASVGQAATNAAVTVLPARVSHTLGLTTKEPAKEAQIDKGEDKTPEKDTKELPGDKAEPTPPRTASLQTASDFMSATADKPTSFTSPTSAVTGNPVIAKSISPDDDVQLAAANSKHDFVVPIPNGQNSCPTSERKDQLLSGPGNKLRPNTEPSPKLIVRIMSVEASPSQYKDDRLPPTPPPKHLSTGTAVSISSTQAVVGSDSTRDNSSSESSPVYYSPVNTDSNLNTINPHLPSKHTPISSESSNDLYPSRHSRGASGKVSLKDRIKGELKVVKGKIQKNEGMIEQGKKLKAGSND